VVWSLDAAVIAAGPQLWALCAAAPGRFSFRPLAPPPSATVTLSLHDALPIWLSVLGKVPAPSVSVTPAGTIVCPVPLIVPSSQLDPTAHVRTPLPPRRPPPPPPSLIVSFLVTLWLRNSAPPVIWISPGLKVTP